MLKRMILSAAAAAAVVGGVLIVKALKKTPEVKDEEEDDDDEIHFITIDNGDEEAKEVKDASDKPEAVQELCGVYPYLDPDFVEETLNSNKQLMEEYEDDTLVTVTHTASFSEEAMAAQYTDIMDTAGYTVEQGENHSVKVGKKLFTQDGAIISDVLNVANQVAALHGTYQGYKTVK